MTTDVKMQLKKKARNANGLLNLLRDDIDQINHDANYFDIICLEESVRDANDTMRMISDNIKEIEYLLYLSRQVDSRQ